MKILKKLSDNNFHGSVLTTMSIVIHEGPVFGSRVNYTPIPMLFIVVKDDEEVKTLGRLE